MHEEPSGSKSPRARAVVVHLNNQLESKITVGLRSAELAELAPVVRQNRCMVHCVFASEPVHR